MPRTRQLKTAQRIFEDDERRKAEDLASIERQLIQSEAKLAELEGYQADYIREFARRAGGGMTAASARDYQAFMARLEEALRQQAELVTRARPACRAARQVARCGPALRGRRPCRRAPRER